MPAEATTSPELAYFPERPRIDSSAVAWYVFIFPLVVVALVSTFAPEWALPAGLVVALFFWVRRKQAIKVPHATLRIQDQRLEVVDRKGTQLLSVRLDDLQNVVLDTKTIQKVSENLSSGMADIRFIDLRVGPGIDNSRIQLVTTSTTMSLTEFHTSSIDATEWFSKIRRFLRKNGWVPADERHPLAQ